MNPHRRLRVAARVAGVLLLAGPWQAPAARAAPGTTWEQWTHLSGVVDVGGPRSDGSLVVSAGGRLSRLSAAGKLAPLARGTDGYSTRTGEPYFTVSPGTATRSGCRFPKDDVYAIEQGSPPGIVHVDAGGRASRLVSLPMVEGLSGIAFDTVGRFGNLLLVTAGKQGRGVLLTVDCGGQVTTVTDAAPTVEGGIEVAPDSFGRYAGDLIAVSEGAGNVVAIGPGGDSGVVVASGVPAGGDIGVESVGFLPKGFTAGGSAFVADRGNQPQPHPGTDTLLRLSSEALAATGVHDGDLLAATEGGGITIAVACSVTCSARTVASASPVAHIEGHILAITGSGPAPAHAGGGRTWAWTAAGVAGAVAVAAAAALILRGKPQGFGSSQRVTKLPRLASAASTTSPEGGLGPRSGRSRISTVYPSDP